MGADNSKSDSQKAREDYTEKVLKQTLATQRQMYEQKCEELKKAQRLAVRSLQLAQNNINGNQTPNNNANQQTSIPASTQLYPNLYNIANNNAQMTTAYTNPSTSCFQNPSNTQFSPVLPSAPSAPTAPASTEGLKTTAHSVRNSLPSQTQPRLNQSQPEHPIAQSSRAIPSTSSAKVLPFTSKPQSRNAPRYEASQSIVKCVTCNDELGLYIYQCKNGHSSCKECRLKNARCGICPEFISDMRNITLEAHIAELKRHEFNDGKLSFCPHAGDGCRLSFKRNEIDEHIKECPYREMACPLAEIFGICTWTGKINQLVMHFKEEHREHFEADVNKEMYLVNIDVNHRVVHLVNLGPFHFLVHLEVNQEQKIICMTVQTMSTKFSASKWSYELHVYNKRQPRRKYKYIDTCISNSETVKEVFSQKKCAVLSADYARTFLENKKLTYRFYIKNNFDPRRNVE
ncbi:E3 ubiquitin-protein ligase siah2-like [Pararge aegeria]|uniref:E3 ubiquitin-protein ligase siah2-like n=1 Tax=Pararge aegeria TaxID=116150 RepID=UPI0019CFA2E8|nr:E3 ubiquitin-protein ligase siah2-like [Pararge aegeria]XP_039752099.1 E3 ubiquitin-protein ligase siah2-like [Pararge aegeria]XP_039752100.1 E3 ubiquitin-protein ligase siah2-like [Pararge aegeria]XP_039752101.1 E3 ubiquitin-protein ligase siah2-like [Pararge aegeria]